MLMQENNDWWTKTVTFLKENIHTVLCVIKESEHSDLTKTVLGMFGESMEEVMDLGMDATWRFAEKMLDTTKTFLIDALKHIDATMADSGKLLSANFFNQLLLKALHDFARVEPTLICMVPVVKTYLDKPEVKLMEQQAVSQVNNFVEKWIFGQGANIWVHVLEWSADKLTKIMPDEWQEDLERLRVTATAGILQIENTVASAVMTGLKEIDGLPPGDLRSKAVTQVKNLVELKIEPSKLLRVGFQVIQKLISDKVNDHVMAMLPFWWDTILNFVSVVVLPAATFGLNEAAASGSCATEWISTIVLNAVQGVWEFFQTQGKNAFFSLTPQIVSETLNFIFNSLYSTAVKPAAAMILPVDSMIAQFVSMIKTHLKRLTDLMPPGVMTVIHAQIKLMFEAVLRQVSPELGKSTKLNLQFARALVNRESQ